jgi:hypothetical protein
MAITAQTISRSDLRVWAFTRDRFVEGNRDHVYSHSPSVAVFFNKTLGDYGGVRMRGAGHKVDVGGASVLVRTRLGKHAGSKAMAGPWDTHSTSPDDNTRLAEANWKHYSGALVISDYDRAVNAGEEKMADFVEDQTESVMLSLADTIGDDLWSLASGTDDITSLDALITAGGAAVQGLDGDTYTYYNARGVSARGTAVGSVSFASGSFAAQGISDMRRAYNNSSEGSKQPNVIFTDYVTHERYEGALQPLERFAGAVNTADASFQALAFRKRPVIADPKVTAGYMYFLRVGSDGVQARILSPFDFKFAPFKPAAAQEAFISELQWKGQVVVYDRRCNNKLTGITD